MSDYDCERSYEVLKALRPFKKQLITNYEKTLILKRLKKPKPKGVESEHSQF
jgi:hypothetical protein